MRDPVAVAARTPEGRSVFLPRRRGNAPDRTEHWTERAWMNRRIPEYRWQWRCSSICLSAQFYCWKHWSSIFAAFTAAVVLNQHVARVCGSAWSKGGMSSSRCWPANKWCTFALVVIYIYEKQEMSLLMYMSYTYVLWIWAIIYIYMERKPAAACQHALCLWKVITFTRETAYSHSAKRNSIDDDDNNNITYHLPFNDVVARERATEWRNENDIPACHNDDVVVVQLLAKRKWW